MTQVEPSRRLQSIGLLPDTPITVLGRGQVALTAAEILRVVGAAVRVNESSAYDMDLAELADEGLVVCDIVEEGAKARYLASVAARTGGAWVTVSAFGLDGPKGGEKGSDLVCAAAGGLLQSVSDPGGGVHPMPGSQALRAAGQAAALARFTPCPWCGAARSRCTSISRSKKRWRTARSRRMPLRCCTRSDRLG